MTDKGDGANYRWTALALLGAATLAASPALGQEPPDYVGLSQKADRLAVAVTSTKSCVHFGYPDPQQALTTMAQALVDEAERSGIPGQTADAIVISAVKTESARQDARTQALERNKSDPAAMESFLDYWERRCEDLASDPDYGHLFKR